jgi:hypothetical protein
MKNSTFLCCALIWDIFLIGCVTVTPGGFNDSKICSIEVNTISYERIFQKDEVDKFEKAVIDSLISKGYRAFSGPRIIDNFILLKSAAEELKSESTADAFMIISFNSQIRKAKMYIAGKYVGETLWNLRVSYAIFDRNLNSVSSNTVSTARKSQKIYFEDPNFMLIDALSIIDPEAGTFKIMESEREFRSRTIADFVSKIPDAN